MDAGGLYKLGTMTNSEQNVIFVYIYLDGGLRVGWFCTSTKTAHSYVIQSDVSLSIQIHLTLCVLTCFNATYDPVLSCLRTLASLLA